MGEGWRANGSATSMRLEISQMVSLPAKPAKPAKPDNARQLRYRGYGSHARLRMRASRSPVFLLSRLRHASVEEAVAN